MIYEYNSINIIYEDRTQDGKLLKDYKKSWFDPDGGRFDYGQEEITSEIHDLSYMGQWDAEIVNQDTLKITSEPDINMGIQSSRIFFLDPESSALKVNQTMWNISDRPVEYFFWGRTLVKPEGKLFMPLNQNSLIKGQWGRYIWGDPEIYETDPGDPGVSIADNIFSLIPAKAGNAKYGTDSKSGWMAYGYKGLLFFKKYNFYENLIYGEKYHQTNIFYTNKTLFAEMEPVSPLAKLNPGEKYSYNENWYLIEYPPSSDYNFDVSAAAKIIDSHDYPTE